MQSTVSYAINFGAPELLIVLVIVVLLFGAAALPKLARSMGQAQREFKRGLKEGDEESSAPDKTKPGTTEPAG